MFCASEFCVTIKGYTSNYLDDKRDEGKINREERAILDERNGM